MNGLVGGCGFVESYCSYSRICLGEIIFSEPHCDELCLGSIPYYDRGFLRCELLS